MNDRFFDSSSEPSTLIELLRERAMRQPDQLGYTFLLDGEASEARMTYAQLDQRARAIGALLQEAGAAHERALLLYPPGLDYIAAFFGCLYAGVVAVPAYPPNPARLERTLPRLSAIVESAQPMVALTTTPILGLVGALGAQDAAFAKPRWMATDALPEALADVWQHPGAERETLAFLQYTSGSTATPKGVMLTHGNLLHNSLLIARCFEHTTESQGVIWLPPYHDMGLIGGIIQPLYRGFPVALMSPVDFLQRPMRWLQAVSRYRATTSGGPNFAYDVCARKVTPEQLATLDLSRWKVAFNGAEPVRQESLERFAATFAPCGFRSEAFYPCYGLAEATLIVSGGQAANRPVVRMVDGAALERHQAIAATDMTVDGRQFIGCGQSLYQQEVVIVDPQTLMERPAGWVGEIWVRGPSVARGYWQRAEESTATFGACLAGGGAGPFLRTGDLGFVLDDELFVTGRIKDLIIIRGRNHYPQDIELTVERSHGALRPGCGAAVAVMIDGEERLVVVQEVEREHRSVNSDEVIAAIRSAVADQHEVHTYAVVLLKPGGIPKTSSGKIQRHACRAGFLAGSLEMLASSVLDEVVPTIELVVLDRARLLAADAEVRPALLASYLRDRLARSVGIAPTQIEVHEPISGLGIDSLMAVDLQHGVESDLGVMVSMVSFLEGASIAQVVAEVLTRLEERPMALVAAPSVTDHPLAQGQQALWFLHQMAPESNAYTIASAVRIRGALDHAAFRRAIAVLVARHPALRTTFVSAQGVPVQRVHAQAAEVFQEEDAATLSDAALGERLAAEALRPFDIERGPLLRLQLFARSSSEHVLLLAVHHIVSDLWSLAVLLQELGMVYGAEVSAMPVALAPLVVQYADYVRWQEQMLAGAEGERLRAYWQRRLASPTTLQLPTDHPRPLVQTYHGAAYVFEIDAVLAGQLRGLAEAHRTTLYTLLLTVFQVLLARYSGQDDILVGTPIAGRGRADLAGVVGYFVNTIVLRAELRGGIRFTALLEQMRQRVLEAFAHQEYPFVTLVEHIQPQRDVSRSPIFQVMFALQKAPLLGAEGLTAFAVGQAGAQLPVGGLVFEALPLAQRIAQFDVTLTMGEVAGGIVGSFEYNVDLFEPSSIARMAEHFQVLLAGVVADPMCSVWDLPLVSDGERRVFAEWNATASEGPRDLGVHQRFEAQVGQTPDAVALVCSYRAGEGLGGGLVASVQLTYGALNRRANQVAHALRARGVGPESLVGVCAERSPELLVAILGVLKAGGAYVPLDPTYPSERLRFMLSDTGAQVLVATRHTRALVDAPGGDARGQVPTVVYVDADWSMIAGYAEGNLDDVVDDARAACVIYTSGSTGLPKGVVLCHGGIGNLVVSFVRSYHPGSYDRILPLTSLASASFVGEIFPLLCAGGALVLPDMHEVLDFERMFALVAARYVTIVSTVPATIAGLNARQRDLPKPRLILSGGEALAARDVDALIGVTTIANGYGLTETTVCSTYYHVGEQDRGALGHIPVGRPIVNAEVYVVNARMQPMPIGCVGDLYVAGVGLARGYLGDAERTAEVFIPNPFVAQRREHMAEGGAIYTRLYRTGDLARWRADGQIEFVGRADQQVKIRGFRIELGEVEAALREHPAVQEAVVIAREDVAGERRLVGYVVLRVGGAEAEALSAQAAPVFAQVRSFLRERLPDYMLPSAFVALEQVPLTPNGKVDVGALPLPAQVRPDMDVSYAAPRSELEGMIAAIWQEALQVDRVGVNDNFFELGGHSLMIVQIHSRLRERFAHLSLVDMFKYPTVGSLARFLSPDEPTQPTFDETLDRANRQRDARARRRMQMRDVD